MALSPFNLFKRKSKVADPFGADDDLWGPDPDDGETFTSGPKVALIISSVFGLLVLVAVGGALVLVDDTAGTSGGSIALTETGEVLGGGVEVTASGESASLIGEEGADQTDGSTASAIPSGPDLTGATTTNRGGSGSLANMQTENRRTNAIGLPLADSALVDDETADADRDIRRRPWLRQEDGPATIELEVDAPEVETAEEPNSAGGRLLMPITDEELGIQREEQDLADFESGAMPELREGETAQEYRDRLAELAQQATTVFADEAQVIYRDRSGLREQLPPGTPGLEQSEFEMADGRPRLVDPDRPPRRPGERIAPPPRFNTLPPFTPQRYTSSDTRKPVAVIISGLGINREATDAAIDKLPADVTLAFSPYAVNLKAWIERAQEKGHEVLVEVATEGRSFPADDPGPLGLFTTMEVIENRQRLADILERADGANGVIDPMGGEFRRVPAQFNPIQVDLSRAGLFYIQGRPGIEEYNFRVPHAVADTIIDERPFRAGIDARLNYLERMADFQGNAVGIAEALPVTYERVLLWTENLRARGYVLAPVSAVLRQTNT